MSSGYYDKWRKGSGSAPSEGYKTAVDGQVERLRYMEERLQGCQSVIDRLVSRVGECESRAEASSRLAQLTQQVAEQSTEESGEAFQELQARSRRQEEVIKKLINEVDTLHAVRDTERDRSLHSKPSQAQLETLLHSKMEDMRRSLSEQMREQMDELRADYDHRLLRVTKDTQADVRKAATQLSKAMEDLHTDMNALKDFVKDEVKAVRHYCDSRIKVIDEQDRRAGKSHEEMSDFATFQSSVVSNVVALQQHCRKLEGQVAEHTTLLKHASGVDERIDHHDQRFLELDRLKADFGEHVGVFKGHLQKQTKRASDTSTAIQQLIEMTDASRAAITTEIMGVKEWAMRCLQRLRKRTEHALQDSRIARDEVLEVAAKLNRTESARERTAALGDLLSQQTEKVLLDVVDKEAHAFRDRGRGRERNPSDSRSPSCEYEWDAAGCARALHDHYLDAKARAKVTHRDLSEDRIESARRSPQRRGRS
eukprot:TRINITY_DN38255_c0_g1_i1.p1 TRINITY_DN38255_c0_g1~~TRINITY_DN38255_c0_g1_i1.p1  ORF type:complete len:481 (+),score=170.70 TRINITY_DN38255_c0_g1_i1:77-1519(+)